jgi:hypothetical protein
MSTKIQVIGGGGARPSWPDTTPGTITGAANVGAGTGLIYRNVTAGVINLKSLIAGTNILIANNADDITISAAGFSQFQLFSDQLQTPNNPDWAVNANAPAAPDDLNNSFSARYFDDTIEQGVGIIVKTPVGATNLILQIHGRARVAPGVAKNVQTVLYSREIADNTAVGAWSAGTNLTLLSMPANTRYQYDSETLTFAGLGLTAGRLTQFELTRKDAATVNKLVGDFLIMELQVSFS